MGERAGESKANLVWTKVPMMVANPGPCNPKGSWRELRIALLLSARHELELAEDRLDLHLGSIGFRERLWVAFGSAMRRPGRFLLLRVCAERLPASGVRAQDPLAC